MGNRRDNETFRNHKIMASMDRIIKNTDDTKIKEIKELLPPIAHLYEVPITEEVSHTIYDTRHEISDIIHGKDKRLIVIVGPCSIHDVDVALDYASRLKPLKDKYKDRLLVIMRVYFEKPRTTVGWKGLINDPRLDGSFDINAGLRLARKLLMDINKMGVPAATEFLDMITPQYIADLISWGAIGARTTESQVHRELASGLSCPVGFKNGTDGNLKIAIDAIGAAERQHHFLSVTKSGHSAIVHTAGNPDCHCILRGGKEPNYSAAHVKDAVEMLTKNNHDPYVMIDVSHANSNKDFSKQPLVIEDICGQIENGDNSIMGVMIESNIVAGRQDYSPDKELVYGQSITDGCISWEDTEKVLARLNEAMKTRIA